MSHHSFNPSTNHATDATIHQTPCMMSEPGSECSPKAFQSMPIPSTSNPSLSDHESSLYVRLQALAGGPSATLNTTMSLKPEECVSSDPVLSEHEDHGASFISDAGEAHLVRVGVVPGKGQATELSLILNIITGGLGAGILSLPWSTAGASLIPAFCIIAIVLAVNAWTIIILVQVAERKQAFDLGAVLAYLPGTLGPFMQRVTNISVWVSIFGLLVGYLIVICDSINRFVGEKNAPDRRLILGISCGVLIVLCFLDVSRLSFTSTLTIAINVSIFVFLMVLAGNKALDGKLPSTCMIGIGYGTISMVTAMTQAVIIQMCVIPMYAELRDRTPQKMKRIVIVSFSALFVIFALFCAAGEIMFGTHTADNVLKNLPKSKWGDAAQLGMVVVSASVYPIMFMAMISPVRNSQRLKPHAGWLTVVVIVASACVAYPVQDLGFMNVLNGAMCVGIFTGLIPACVGSFILKKNGLLMSTLVVVCCAMSVLGFSFTDNYVGGLHCFLRWSPMESGHHKNVLSKHEVTEVMQI